MRSDGPPPNGPETPRNAAPEEMPGSFMRPILPVSFPITIPVPRTSSKVHDVSLPETENATPKLGMISHGSSMSVSSQSTQASSEGRGEKSKMSMKSLPSLARTGYPIEVSHLSYGIMVNSLVPRAAQRMFAAAPIAPLHHAHPHGIATPEGEEEEGDEEAGCLEAGEGVQRVVVDPAPAVKGTVSLTRTSTWSHLSGSFHQAMLPPSQVKTILNDVSFTASPGQVLAVVGSSGAGKSTVLDALAGRIRSKSLQGQILVNGQPTGSKSYKRLIGYVMQDEALFAMLTPRETLMLSACLRLPSSISKKEKAERVEQLLAHLGLMVCSRPCPSLPPSMSTA